MGGMYNALFGANEAAPVLLKILNITKEQTGRFRDAYVENDHIVIYTRNGGGNRESYQKDIDFMRAHPNFIKDYDDSFDSTYAYFEFSVPEGKVEVKPGDSWEISRVIERLVEFQNAIGFINPHKRWEKLLGDLNERKDTPDTKRALTVGRKIGEAIAKISKDDEKK